MCEMHLKIIMILFAVLFWDSAKNQGDTFWRIYMKCKDFYFNSFHPIKVNFCCELLKPRSYTLITCTSSEIMINVYAGAVLNN